MLADNADKYRQCQTMIVPLLSACEAEELLGDEHPYLLVLRRLPPGTEMLALGLGSPTVGSKRALPMVISPSHTPLPRPSLVLSALDDTMGIRPGDSGGPTFLELADGTWRQLGVHNQLMGSIAIDMFIPSGMDFIRSTTDVDLWPCHAPGPAGDDTVWDPAACPPAPSELEGARGTWPMCHVEERMRTPTCAMIGPSTDSGVALDAGALDAGWADTGSPATDASTQLDAHLDAAEVPSRIVSGCTGCVVGRSEGHPLVGLLGSMALLGLALCRARLRHDER